MTRRQKSLKKAIEWHFLRGLIREDSAADFFNPVAAKMKNILPLLDGRDGDLQLVGTDEEVGPLARAFETAVREALAALQEKGLVRKMDVIPAADSQTYIARGGEPEEVICCSVQSVPTWRIWFGTAGQPPVRERMEAVTQGRIQPQVLSP